MILAEQGQPCLLVPTIRAGSKKKILPMPYWNEFNISTCGTFISAVPTLFVLYTFYKSQFRKTRHKILLNIVTTLEN